MGNFPFLCVLLASTSNEQRAPRTQFHRTIVERTLDHTAKHTLNHVHTDVPEAFARFGSVLVPMHWQNGTNDGWRRYG